jgi:hypothetical protein
MKGKARNARNVETEAKTKRRVEYVGCSLFCTLAELRKAERRKSMLENAGYRLTHQTATLSTYVRT